MKLQKLKLRVTKKTARFLQECGEAFGMETFSFDGSVDPNSVLTKAGLRALSRNQSGGRPVIDD